MSQLNFEFSGDVLKKIGLRAIEMIEENVARGVDADGKPFAPYSTKPFSMPLGAFFENTTKRQRERLASEGDLSIFRTKTGRRWITIDGGYANFKNARFLQDGGRVNLQVRGSRGRGMLSQLSVLRTVDTKNEKSVVIGFLSGEAATLAYFHNVSGAGRSRTIRRFLGVTPVQQKELASIVDKAFKV